MTNCTNNNRAEEVFSRIIESLDGNHLKAIIDEPIDMVVGEFQIEEIQQVSHKEFCETISTFIHDIYEKGIGLVTNSDWHSKGLALIEKHYKRVYSSGYTAAALDLINPDCGGIGFVLHGIAESIKTIEREKYIKAVYARYIGDDWHLRYEIADMIIKQWALFLTPEIRQSAPEQLADDIPSLIKPYLDSSSVLQNLANSR